MSIKYVVSHLEQQLGPLDESEIKAKWEAGELLPIDYVYVEARQDWVLLSEQFPWASNSQIQDLEKTLILPTTEAAPPPLTEIKRPKGEEVKLIDGLGQIDLSPREPGKVEIVVRDSGALKLQEPLKINVKAAEPAELIWTFPAQQICGQEIEIVAKAVDEKGRVCEQYQEQLLLKINAQEMREVPVFIEKGQAVLKFQHVKAEAWIINLEVKGQGRLKLPDPRSLEWKPSDAVRLVLDGPREYLAGHPIKVQVRAVDAYGNLAKTFQGTVILEVKAS